MDLRTSTGLKCMDQIRKAFLNVDSREAVLEGPLRNTNGCLPIYDLREEWPGPMSANDGSGHEAGIGMALTTVRFDRIADQTERMGIPATLPGTNYFGRVGAGETALWRVTRNCEADPSI